MLNRSPDKTVNGKWVADWSDYTGTALVKPDGTVVGIGGTSAAVVGSGDTTGVTDAAAIAAALVTAAAGNKTISFAGDIYLGDKAVAYRAIDLSALGDNWTFVSYGAKFHLNTTGAVVNEIFHLQDNSNISFLGNWYAIDAGANKADAETDTFSTGLTFLKIFDNCSNIYVNSIFGSSCRAAVHVGDSIGADAGTCDAIVVDSIRAFRCAYGVVLVDNGDLSTYRSIVTERTGRSFFCFGVENVQAHIVQTNAPPGHGVEIKRYTRNTKNIYLKVSDSRNTSYALYTNSAIVHFDHANNDGASSIIDSCDVDVSAIITDGSAAEATAALVAFNDHNVSDAINNPATHSNTNIRISGSLGPYSLWVNSETHSRGGIAGGPISLPPGAKLMGAIDSQYWVDTPRSKNSPIIEKQVAFLVPDIAVASYKASGAIITDTGTVTARTPNRTNIFTAAKRVGFVSAAGAGSSAGFFFTGKEYSKGNASTLLGGYDITFVFGLSSAAPVANGRAFFGLYATASVIGNVEPSSLVNTMGIGWDAGETKISLMHNDGSGTATKTDLGANFPTDTVSTDWYEFKLYMPFNSFYPRYRLTNLSTGNYTEEINESGDVPGNTTMLGFQAWVNNGATASAIGLDVGGLYIEAHNGR